MQFSFFIPYYREGGVETTTRRLASEFENRGHCVDLITFGHDSPYLGPDSPFDVVDLGANRTLRSVPSLAAYLRRSDPDVLLATHYFANIAAVLARLGARVDTPLVLTERLLISHVIEKEPHLKARLFPTAMRLTYPRADRCVTVSKAAAADLRDLADLDEEQVTAIYNPTLTDEVYKLAEASVDHPWLEESKDAPVVLGVGRLTGQKDFPTLLRAFAHLLDRREARLIVLGEGEDRSRLESLADQLDVSDRVDFHGYVDNPYAFMDEANLFVLSSRFEGMPNVLVEAAALETPVVATDCPSGPRELLNDGEAGELVPVGEPAEMADAMDYQLANSEEARRRISSIRSTLEEFRPETSSERYLDLFKEIRSR